MWFKNLQLYRLTKPFTLTAEALDEELQSRKFRHCGPLELSVAGWDSPIRLPEAPLVHAANGYFMVCLRREDKVLPSAVIREVVDERAELIKEEQGRDIGRREWRELRDNVEQELIPKAFSKSNRTYAYIDPKENWLVVDASSAKRAEELVSLLRETLGSLPAKPIKVNHAPADVFTRWLLGQQCSEGFELGDECELRSPLEDGAIVRCRHQELASEEIRGHLDAGKQAVRLALSWHDHLELIVDEELAVKRLRFSDLIMEEAMEMGVEDEAARFDADFSLMTLELNKFFPALVEVFDGLDES